jgi:hypothetical protein
MLVIFVFFSISRVLIWYCSQVETVSKSGKSNGQISGRSKSQLASLVDRRSIKVVHQQQLTILGSNLFSCHYLDESSFSFYYYGYYGSYTPSVMLKVAGIDRLSRCLMYVGGSSTEPSLAVPNSAKRSWIHVTSYVESCLIIHCYSS